MRKMLLPIPLLLSFLALTAAQAQPGPPMLPPPPPEALIERYAEELGLDEATLERIRALSDQHRAEQQGILTELQQQKIALRTALSAEQPDEASVIALARKIGTLESDLSVARLTSLMRIRAELTPKQNAALREKMERRFAERRAQIDQVLTACETEISQHCADQAGGPPPHALMCLMEKRMSENVTLSATCETSLKELPPPPMFPGRMPPPEVTDVMGEPPFHARDVKESE